MQHLSEPSLIDSPFIEMVFPRRPTVICVEENEGREFLSFILPLTVLLLLGTVFIMYILYKTLVVCVYTYILCIYICMYVGECQFIVCLISMHRVCKHCIRVRVYACTNR